MKNSYQMGRDNVRHGVKDFLEGDAGEGRLASGNRSVLRWLDEVVAIVNNPHVDKNEYNRGMGDEAERLKTALKELVKSS